MALRAAWTTATKGRLPAIEQAKLWGLREALRKLGQPTDQHTWMASQVQVSGGGHPDRRVAFKSIASVRKPWEETPTELAARLQTVVAGINRDCDVSGLCMEFPDRLLKLRQSKGGRLKK